VLPGLPAATFDCCIADPPYGDTNLRWDSRCDGWIPAVARVLRPAASMWVFGSMRFLAPLFAEMAQHGFVYSQDIVWEKHNGSSFHNDRFRRVHEHAVLFYRGRWSDVWHATQYSMDARARTVRRKIRTPHWHGATGAHEYVSEDGGPRMLRSVLQIRSEHGRAIHPTQKPVDLVLPLLRYACPVGGSVVDPFGGSGTTALAAAIAGCDATLIESDTAHIDAAAKRLGLPSFERAA